VVAVSVDVCAVVLLMVTEEGERLHCVPLTAAVGEATEQVRVTVPVNEFDGVTVMVEVLPVVAAGLTEMFPLLVRVKLVLVLGASQKPAHPARIGVARSNSRAHFPIFIASPCQPLTSVFRSQGIASARAASSHRTQTGCLCSARKDACSQVSARIRAWRPSGKTRTCTSNPTLAFISHNKSRQHDLAP
jgi:hypothetical protein